MNSALEIAGTDTQIDVTSAGDGCKFLMTRYVRAAAHALAIGGVVLLGSCGGGGGGSHAPPPVGYTAGVYPVSSSVKNQCAAPIGAGSTATENNWLRSWTNELYLWYAEAPDLNPNNTATTAAYFDLMKTSAVTPSGQPKDKFHFTYPTATWEALSQSGVDVGYGAAWDIVGANVFVAYTDPNTVATTNGIVRGAQVITVDGVDLATVSTQAGVDVINAGLFPSALAQMHSFRIIDPGVTTPRGVTMTSANITAAPVQNAHVIPNTTVGYMLFNDHHATAEKALFDAVTQLKALNITDLVLDIRYNLGGYLDIASELAYMIADPALTVGKTFELTVFNDKHPTTDPVTGQPITPMGFHSNSLGFGATPPAGTALPNLGLTSVYVLTGPDTCSASESVINSLRGVGINVIQIGSTTCGKPYGFHPTDNCGTTYFSIQFKGVNQMVFGDYPDGFSPMNTSANAGVLVPGCSVADDLSHALGDPNEFRLAAALAYRTTPGTCPPATGAFKQMQIVGAPPSRADGTVPKSPWHQNRIYRH